MSADVFASKRKPINHGTHGGYMRCKNSRYGACEPCVKACRDYQHAWRISTGKSVNTLLDNDLLAKLYLSASPDMQELIEQRIPTKVLDAIVAVHDAANITNELAAVG